MTKLSVIIPSRNELFLPQTVNDLFTKAAGEIEVIVVLDGYWPDPMLDRHHELIYLRRGHAMGMRSAINSAASIATGKYLMKVDAHCMFGEGFDEILKADCDDNWVVIPRRKRLDAENWQPVDDGRLPIDYEYLGYPYRKEGHVGIHGTVWGKRTEERMDDPQYDIDDNMAFQGSCWFTTKAHFWNGIGGLQEEGYGTFIGEPQEIGNKTWLGGGRLIVNKKTWYAHLHKGRRYGRGYFMSKSETHAGNLYSVNYWMRNIWPERVHDIEWLVDKFSPVPSWPDDKSTWKLKEEDFVDIQTEQPAKAFPSVEIISKDEPTKYILDKYSADPSQRMPISLSITRDDLPDLFHELGYKVGAEIGIERAMYSEKLCKAGLKLYAIDPWRRYTGYREHVTQGKLDRFLQETQDRLEPYDHQIIRAFSVDALKLFDDESLDFVYIDGNHEFLHVTQDIAGWEKKVRKGGIVAGHDFSRKKPTSKYILHVKDVVQAWTYSHHITPWFLTRGDRRSPSWFWVKE